MFGGSHAQVPGEQGTGLPANGRASHQIPLQCRVLALVLDPIGEREEAGRWRGQFLLSQSSSTTVCT